MKTLIALCLCIPVLVAATPEPLAVTCFSRGERVSGMNKICFYDCMGSDVAINVKSYELCPLTIQR